MFYYFQKFYLILFIFSLTVNCCYVNATDLQEEERDKRPQKQGVKRVRKPSKIKEEKSDKQSEKTQEPNKNRQRIEEEDEEETERVDSEEHEITSEEEEEDKSSSSGEKLPNVAKEIGVWVGGREEGLEHLNLTYKEVNIDCLEIIKWHKESGQNMTRLIELLGTGIVRNPLIVRIDLAYKIEENYKTLAIEIPAVFISGANYKQEDDIEFAKIQEAVRKLRGVPTIPVNYYIGWIGRLKKKDLNLSMKRLDHYGKIIVP